MPEEFGRLLRSAEKWARSLIIRRPAPRVAAVDQMLRTSLQWDDVFDSPAPSLLAVAKRIRKFNAWNLLEVLSRLSMVYHSRMPRGGNVRIPKQYFSEGALERMERNHSGREPIHFTRTTLLYAQMLVLRWGKFEGGTLVQEDHDSFIRLLLGCSIFSEGRDADMVSVEAVAETMGYLYRNYTLNKTSDLASRIGRYWYFVAHYPKALPKEQNISDQISKALGNSPEVLAALSFGLLAKYIRSEEGLAQLNAKPEEFITPVTYFDTMPKHIADVAKEVFSTISRTREEFRSFLGDQRSPRSGYDCRTVFDTPFFNANNGALIPLDVAFLADQGHSGLFFKTYSAIEKSKRNHFADSWGRTFEHHIAELFKSEMPGMLGKRLFIEKEHGFENVDFVIRDGENLIFIEATISRVPILKILNDNWTTIKPSVWRILFEREQGVHGKVMQLASAIKRFKVGELRLPGVDPRAIKRIFPVVVLEHAIPQIPLIIDDIREEAFVRTGLDEFRKFEMWDIDELELIAPLLKKRFSDEIEDKHQSAFGKYPMKNFISQKAPEQERSRYMQMLWETASSEIQTTLFPGAR